MRTDKGSVTTPDTETDQSRIVLAFSIDEGQLEQLRLGLLGQDAIVSVEIADHKGASVLVATKQPAIMWDRVQHLIRQLISDFVDDTIEIELMVSGYDGRTALFVTRPSQAGYKKLTINMSLEVYVELLRVCEAAGTDLTELLKRSVALHKFLWEHRDRKLKDVLRLVGLEPPPDPS